jgi:hypothetical protein
VSLNPELVQEYTYELYERSRMTIRRAHPGEPYGNLTGLSRLITDGGWCWWSEVTPGRVEVIVGKRLGSVMEDADGTLIQQLREHGACFSDAIGRQYASLVIAYAQALDGES